MKFTTDNPEQLADELIAAFDFFLFDLDNTLFRETDYLFPAYKKIADYLSKKRNLNAEAIEKYLTHTFLNEGREKLFNKLLAQFSVPESEMGNILAPLRDTQISNKISLYPEMEIFIRDLVSHEKNVLVVTNGNVQQQKCKVQNIDWKGLDRNIEFVYAAALKPKPDRAAFDYLQKLKGVVKEKSVMIGDTETDSAFAQNAGIHFVSVSAFFRQ
jgi:HAD superfamily hydrolase (TIGR01549 family)